MPDREHDFDPWSDTHAERGEERDDTFDDGSVGSPFGAMSEILGVPRQVPGYRARRGPPPTRPLTPLLVLVVVLLAASAVGILVWLL